MKTRPKILILTATRAFARIIQLETTHERMSVWTARTAEA
jgi:hypothetical protein